MVQRGGGVEDLRFRRLTENIIVVELLVNVKDSMGANVINSIAEFTAPYIQSLLEQGKIGIKILSNLCTERMTMAEFHIPVKNLAWKNAKGSEVASKILEAQKFAELD
jgi:hydroxymethylglutaryl-CoA synthase